MEIGLIYPLPCPIDLSIVPPDFICLLAKKMLTVTSSLPIYRIHLKTSTPPAGFFRESRSRRPISTSGARLSGANFRNVGRRLRNSLDHVQCSGENSRPRHRQRLLLDYSFGIRVGPHARV